MAMAEPKQMQMSMKRKKVDETRSWLAIWPVAGVCRLSRWPPSALPFLVKSITIECHNCLWTCCCCCCCLPYPTVEISEGALVFMCICAYSADCTFIRRFCYLFSILVSQASAIAAGERLTNICTLRCNRRYAWFVPGRSGEKKASQNDVLNRQASGCNRSQLFVAHLEKPHRLSCHTSNNNRSKMAYKRMW